MRRARFSPTMPDKNNLFYEMLCTERKYQVAKRLTFAKTSSKACCFFYEVLSVSFCTLSLISCHSAFYLSFCSILMQLLPQNESHFPFAFALFQGTPKVELEPRNRLPLLRNWNEVSLPRPSCGSFQFARKLPPPQFCNSACITRIRRNSPTFLRSTGRLSRQFRMQRSTTSFRQLPLSNVGKHKMRTALVSTSLTPFNAHEFCGELRLRSWRRSGITSPSNLLLACLY